MSLKREIQNEEQLFVYSVNLQLIGTYHMEEAIDQYLQEVIREKFLKSGESISYCNIESIAKKKK